MTMILVTGATGTVGSQLVTALASHPEVEVRAAVRDLAKGSALTKHANVKLVEMDWSKPASIEAALAGVDRAFLLTPLSDEQVAMGKRFVDAAKKAGVKHIVKLSTAGAELTPGTQLGRWHREVEQMIEASGVDYTFLRPGSFMDNFIRYWPPTSEGAIYLPLGTSSTSFVDPKDIAEAAAATLTSDGHAGKVYTITGPEALTTSEVATSLSIATGRAIQYVDVPDTQARSAMKNAGLPPWMIDGLLELYGWMKAGRAAAVSEDAPRLMSRPGRTFDDFARAHAKAWKS